MCKVYRIIMYIRLHFYYTVRNCGCIWTFILRHISSIVTFMCAKMKNIHSWIKLSKYYVHQYKNHDFHTNNKIFFSSCYPFKINRIPYLRNTNAISSSKDPLCDNIISSSDNNQPFLLLKTYGLYIKLYNLLQKFRKLWPI